MVDATHQWKALLARLDCFHISLVSDIPLVVARANLRRLGSSAERPGQDEVDKIRASFDRAHEATKVHVNSLRAKNYRIDEADPDEMHGYAVAVHLRNVVGEVGLCLGATSDMLRIGSGFSLEGAILRVAEVANESYKRACADLKERDRKNAVAAAAAAAAGPDHSSHQQHQAQWQHRVQQQQQQREQQRVQQQRQEQQQQHQTTAAALVMPPPPPPPPQQQEPIQQQAKSDTTRAAAAHHHHQRQQQQHQPDAAGGEKAASAANATRLMGDSGGGQGSNNAPAVTTGQGNSAGAGVGGECGGGWNSIVPVKPGRLSEVVDKDGLLKLPRDGLEVVMEEIHSVNDARMHVIEDARLRPSYVPGPSPSPSPSPEPAAAEHNNESDDETDDSGEASAGRGQTPRDGEEEERKDQPWFARNVVDHRLAWCSLRDAGDRVGLRRMLWGDGNPSGGGPKETQSAVLELMSEATQAFLKRVLEELKTVAWQRRGGLSEDLLQGLKARMDDPALPPPSVELHRGLIPTFFPREEGATDTAATAADPRECLRREEEGHRRACLSREAAWEADIHSAMAAADAERRSRNRRRSLRNEPPQRVGLEALSISSLSGWLSREQLAANEFARRVGIAQGVGLATAAAAEWKRRKNRLVAAAAAEAAKAAAGVSASTAATGAREEAGGAGVGGGDGCGEVRHEQVVGCVDVPGEYVPGEPGENPDGAGQATATNPQPILPVREAEAARQGSALESEDGKVGGVGACATKRRLHAPMLSSLDEAARSYVRNVRRRLQNGSGGRNSDRGIGSDCDRGGDCGYQSPQPHSLGTAAAANSTAAGAAAAVAEPGGERPARRTTEINNADLLEYLRAARSASSNPRGGLAILMALRTRVASQRRRLLHT